MTELIERRQLEDFGVLTLRAEDGEGDEPSRLVTGHAAVFNKLSQELWGFREKIAPGAFAESLREDDAFALWQHDTSTVLAGTRNDSLRMSEDKKGLAFEFDTAKTVPGDTALENIRSGLITQMSFGFNVVKDSWEYPDDQRKLPTRTLEQVRVFDISPVTFPAYTQTDAKAAREHPDFAEAFRGLDLFTQSSDYEAEQLKLRIKLMELTNNA